jgi:hypothetical protein
VSNRAAPWQTYLIAAYAAFVGEAFEGFIVDTNHWRHFFLLLGLVWGLTAASINLRRSQAWSSEFGARGNAHEFGVTCNTLWRR